MDTDVPVIWTDEAKEDLRDVLHYLSRYPSAYVDDWSDQLSRKLNLLASFPEMGRMYPNRNLTYLREILIGNYRLLYIYLNEQITIIRVKHQASELGKL